MIVTKHTYTFQTLKRWLRMLPGDFLTVKLSKKYLLMKFSPPSLKLKYQILSVKQLSNT